VTIKHETMSGVSNESMQGEKYFLIKKKLIFKLLILKLVLKMGKI
jgi:hypothetical protein